MVKVLSSIRESHDYIIMEGEIIVLPTDVDNIACKYGIEQEYKKTLIQVKVKKK